ncbi:MAG: hypothetical protein CMO74_13260 [Verrucomicrobiales bacterium]|nr:hypothetical protein [Verrucomicrobiales bacterium]|tara:strand:- start:22558 stop:23823 length:1266 start_codon:yes stop_codon:yes gene_type:complete
MQITINRDGENHGPYTLEQVRGLLADGTLQQTDLAHVEGTDNWMPVTQVPGLEKESTESSRDIPTTPSTFKCTGCAGELVYSPGAASMECPYCGATVECPEPKGEVLEHDFESQLLALESGAATTTVAEVDCEACGAKNQLEANQTSGECAFCGTPFVQQPQSANTLQPHAVLPFAVTREQGLEHFRSWIKSRWFAPNKLKQFARDIEKLKGLYLPHWTYDTHTITDYTGQRGEAYYVTESYTDSNGNRQTRQVRRIRWYPAWGRVFVNFDDILIPASDTLPRKYVDELEPWDLPKLTPYNDAYLSGFQSESYSTDLRAGFNSAKEKMEPEIDGKIRWDIGGDEQRILSKTTYYHDITFKYILLPVWISAYRFKNRTFQFLVNARTGEVQGERPWSWIKITLAVLAILAVIVTIVYFADQK